MARPMGNYSGLQGNCRDRSCQMMPGERRENECGAMQEEFRDRRCERMREERGERSCGTMQVECDKKRTEVPDVIPTGSKQELLSFIDRISFVVYEMLLYLDTHPYEQEALQYFHENNRLREKALKIYGKTYGPLTIAAADESCPESWEWMRQPWPWEPEGGAC